MMSTFPECFCFLIYQTPPEYEKGITLCSYRQRGSNIYLVNVLLNNRSSLIILGSLHVILYLPFRPACQPHSIGRLHAHMQNTIGGHRAAVQLWAYADITQKHTGCEIFKCWDRSVVRGTVYYCQVLQKSYSYFAHPTVTTRPAQ